MESIKPLKAIKDAKATIEDSDFENEDDEESKWNRPGRKNNLPVKSSSGYQAETSLHIIKKCKSKNTKTKKQFQKHN